jgi:hypothetical protein
MGNFHSRKFRRNSLVSRALVTLFFFAECASAAPRMQLAGHADGATAAFAEGFAHRATWRAQKVGRDRGAWLDERSRFIRHRFSTAAAISLGDKMTPKDRTVHGSVRLTLWLDLGLVHLSVVCAARDARRLWLPAYSVGRSARALSLRAPLVATSDPAKSSVVAERRDACRRASEFPGETAAPWRLFINC